MINDEFKAQMMKDLKYVSDFQKQIETAAQRINKSQIDSNLIKKSKKELDEIKKTVQEVEKMGRYIRFNIQMGVELVRETKPVEVTLRVKNSIKEQIKEDFEGVKKALKFNEASKAIHNTIKAAKQSIENMSDKFKSSKAFKLINKPIEYTIKAKKMIEKVKIYALNNDNVLKRIAETKKAVNELKKNVAITIAAKNAAKESINDLKKNLKDIGSKPFNAIIKAKDQTKGVIDGIRKNIKSLKKLAFGSTSKKIFNSTIGEAMKIEDRFTSSENKSNTATGQIKNIKKSFAGLGANFVGVKDNGQIEAGEVFDTFKKQLSKVVPLLDALKKSDAFKVIKKDLSNVVSGAGNKFSTFIENLMKNPNKLKQQFDKLWSSFKSGISAIVKLGSAVVSLVVKLKPLFDMIAKHPKTVIGLFTAFKIGIPIISSIVTAFIKFKEIKKDIGLLNTSIKAFTSGATSSFLSLFKVMTKSSVTLIILAIIAVVVILYKAWTENWGGIREKTHEVIEFVKKKIESVKETFENVKKQASDFVEETKVYWQGLIEFFRHPIQGTINLIKTISGGSGGKVIGDKIEGKALGTTYFSGGWTWIGEQGPELMKLPGGTQIVDNRKSQAMAGSSLSIAKLADTIVVREDADIDRITYALAKKLTNVGFNCA
ncbi:hypothetical protein JMF89_05565 [Clostridiaceae bacterium UIB06]|uniref:Phage tail tape measure protein n=1 Tax=Clostridium thailandense TaxID=2794346 RepID=A0A949WST8_9CLOT|nr:hypothetical protein [Clostridium thailandense]MBV7275451.1 hypothetical protein [Clostridium thailandense]MCH5136688.1 hypothetical protein [Clostridiaceae bacterium UIB06]